MPGSKRLAAECRHYPAHAAHGRPNRTKYMSAFRPFFMTVVTLAGVLSLHRPAYAQQPADLVVRGARIYTVDAVRPWAEALAVKEGRLVFVGSDSAVDGWIGPGTRVVDARARMILPGFHDAHAHLALSASLRQWCDLGYPPTLEATRQALTDCAQDAADQPWVLATNPNTAVFHKGGPPSGFLDEFVSDRPMVVHSYHSSFTNSAALALAGITAETPDPEHGVIVRDEAGRPTGTLIETAQDLVLDLVPKPSAGEFAAYLREVIDEFVANGIVSVQEITGSGRAALYADALAAGWLTTRVRLAQILEAGPEAPPVEDRAVRFIETAQRYHGDWFNAGTVKLFVDGDLGDRTAALIEPYADAAGDGGRGEPIWSQGELDALVARLDAAGLQLHFHAMGDRAVRMALDAVEHAQGVNGRRDARHQVTHLHVVAPEDLPRFRELGVVANIQPYFAENVEYNTVRALELLGPERHQWMFRFRDLVKSGAVVAVSTDAPVSPISPFVSIQAALTRREPGSADPAFLPEQRLNLPEVLAAYTMGGAYANFLEDVSGSLEVGKSADFVMLDQDLFDLEPEAIRGTRVLWTVIEGRDAFRSADLE